MFDFDVVTGPGDRAKPAHSETRRKQMPPSGGAVPPTAMPGELTKDAAVDDAVDRPSFE